MASLPYHQTALAHTGWQLQTCRVCGRLCRVGTAGAWRCPECHARLPAPHAGTQRCWAFLLAAMLCYVPANLLPVMQTDSLFGRQNDTILSGVVYLWHSGSWPLAMVVFIASILVPLMKIISLGYLLVSVHLRWRWAQVQRTRLYRVLEAIGPWSMLDIYVVALLVALVRWRGLATIHAGPGSLAFAAVVVLTMLAAQAFDPLLIWRPDEEEA